MTLPTRVAAFLLASLCALSAHAATTSDQQALLILNRLAFGPKPGDLDRVKQIGVERYIDEQLHPENIPLSPSLNARLDTLDTANMATGEVLRQFVELRKEARTDGDTKQQQREFVGRVGIRMPIKAQAPGNWQID